MDSIAKADLHQKLSDVFLELETLRSIMSKRVTNPGVSYTDVKDQLEQLLKNLESAMGRHNLNSKEPDIKDLGPFITEIRTAIKSLTDAYNSEAALRGIASKYVNLKSI